MRKGRNIFISLIISISTFVNAQITVSNTDFVPIGKTLIMAFDTLSHQPGNAGANQIWNFPGLQSPFIDTLQADHPGSTPYSGYFPSANVSLSSPAAAYYQYFSNIGTGFYMQGAVVVTGPNPPSVSSFYPQYKYFQWPMNYLDSFSDSCINISIYATQVPSGIDTAKYLTYYNEQTLVDGWGKITTPMGTFDCLRQRKFQARIDSSWYFSSQNGTWSFTGTYTDTIIIYDWLSNNPGTGFMLAEITYIQAAGMYSGAYWLKDAISGINNYENSQVISVYPSPASNILFAKTSDHGTIELHDINGRGLLIENHPSRDHVLDVSPFPNGIYVLLVRDEKNNLYTSIKKIIISR